MTHRIRLGPNHYIEYHIVDSSTTDAHIPVSPTVWEIKTAKDIVFLSIRTVSFIIILSVLFFIYLFSRSRMQVRV